MLTCCKCPRTIISRTTGWNILSRRFPGAVARQRGNRPASLPVCRHPVCRVRCVQAVTRQRVIRAEAAGGQCRWRNGCHYHVPAGFNSGAPGRAHERGAIEPGCMERCYHRRQRAREHQGAVQRAQPHADRHFALCGHRIFHPRLPQSSRRQSIPGRTRCIAVASRYESTRRARACGRRTRT